MCGRYSLICIDDLGRRFRVYDPTLGFRSRFNIAPSQMMPVIVRHEHNKAVMMQWGLVPCRAKDPKTSHRPINARVETLAESPIFSNLLESRRCLVPASGFYEWKTEGTRRIPWYIRIPGSPVFAFAGLYDVWRDPLGQEHLTYTIITTCANELMAPVHDRMPVILRQEDEDRWLSVDTMPVKGWEGMMAPYPSGEMETYPVSPRVNRTDVDDERLIRSLEQLW